VAARLVALVIADFFVLVMHYRQLEVLIGGTVGLFALQLNLRT
jgi:hypothetical protein